MIHSLLPRTTRSFFALLIVTILMTGSALASDLIINTGSNEGLKWSWNVDQPLPGAYYGLVRTKEEAQQLLKQIPAGIQGNTLANIDFTKRAAIVAYLGEAPRGGYAVDIHSMQISDSTVWVNVTRRSPAPDEVTILMVTHPIVVKTLALSDLPNREFTVRFIDQTGKQLAQSNVGTLPELGRVIKLGNDTMLKWKWRATQDLPGGFYTLVSSEQEARVIKARLPKSLRANAFKTIDFTKQVALVSYLGKAPNSGFAVDIHRAELRDSNLRVTLSRRSPSKNEYTLPVVSYPMVVRPIDRNFVTKRPVTVQFFDQKGKVLAQEIVGARSQLHTVQPGQTLWYIAWLYHVRVEDLVRWNNLSITNPLVVGQTLRLNL